MKCVYIYIYIEVLRQEGSLLSIHTSRKARTLLVSFSIVDLILGCCENFTGLFTNFFSFTSFSYKVGLIRTLVDRAYKINNSLLSFNNDVKKLTHIFKKTQFPD